MVNQTAFPSMDHDTRRYGSGENGNEQVSTYCQLPGGPESQKMKVWGHWRNVTSNQSLSEDKGSEG